MATGRLPGASPGLQVVRWSKTPTAGTTTLSGLDDYSVGLTYTAGYESVYLNGVLLDRTTDYTATNGTTIVLATATVAGDIVNVFGTQISPVNGSVPTSTYTTKGDILVATGNNTPVRQGVGADGTVLTANSALADGVEWAALPASGAFTLLSTTTWSNGSAGSITVSSINQTYKHLFISATGFSVTGSPSGITIDPNANGNCSTVGVYTSSGGSSTLFNQGFGEFYLYPSSINTSDTGQGFAGWIYNYTSTVHKPMMFAGAFNSGGGNGRGSNFAGAAKLTSAITSLVFNVAGATSISSGTILIYGVN